VAVTTVAHSQQLASTKSRTPEPGEVSCTVLQHFPEPAIEGVWRDFLGRVKNPSHFNAPEFFYVSPLSGKRLFSILAARGEHMVGVLTGRSQGNNVMCGLPSRPQICIDPNGDTGRVLDALARELLSEAGPAKLVEVYSWDRLDAFTHHGFRCRQLVGNVVVDLKPGPDAIFKKLDKNRRHIRSAIKSGVEVFEATTDEDARSFHRVHFAWHETKRKKILTPKIPLDVFQKMIRHRESFRIFLARYSGQVISGIIVRYYPRGLMEFAANSSLDEFLHLRPNDLLQWRAIEWGCHEGLTCYSLGGAHRFLRKFSDTIVPIYRYRLDRTILRQHEIKEKLEEWGRASLHNMPKAAERAIRWVLRKPAAPGA
jgi:hypothetical protein